MKWSILAASCLMGCAVANPVKSAQQQPPQAVIDWLRPRSTPLGSAESIPDDAQTEAIDRFIGSARVIAFGEIMHLMQEPLAYRNWLVRYLVAQRGLTAVALESGLAQGRRVNDYVLGAPGEAKQIVHDNFSWGFGELAANLELVRWLRAYNADPSHGRVRFYGFDLSGGDVKSSFSDAPLALRELIGYFATAAPTSSTQLRRTLGSFTTRFTPEAYAQNTSAERSNLSAAINQAQRRLANHRPALIAASSTEAYEWAARIALDCRHLLEVFELWPKGDPRRSPAALRKMFQVSDIRDAAMADNITWSLRREGPRGRLLVFAAAGHVAATNLINDQWLIKTTTMQTLGRHLRAAMGQDYRILVTAAGSAVTSGAQGDSGTVNLAIEALGAPPLLVNFRDPPDRGWWQEQQSIGRGADLLRAVPSQAFDGVLFLSQLTAALRIE